MEDKDIIKALEHCVNERSCIGCIAYSPRGCQGIDEGTLNIINRQKAEIERLEELLDSSVSSERNTIDNIPYERAEAIKEFAERLCKDRVSNDPVVIAVKVELKEMVGE